MTKLNLKHCVLLMCLLTASILSAQKEGTFILMVSTPEAYVKIDAQTLEKMSSERTKTYTLTEGVHSFQIWSSGYELLKDTILITANATSRRVVNLKRTAAYVQYRSELGGSALDKAMLMGGKIFIVAGNLGLTWFVALEGRTKSNQQLDLLKLNQRLYESSFSLAELPKLKENFDYSKKNYEKSVKSYNTKLLVGIPLTLAAYYGSYRLFKKMSTFTRKKSRI